MGLYIQSKDQQIAEASTTEDALIESLKAETDPTLIASLATQLATARASKTLAKAMPDDEFADALVLDGEGLPTAFTGRARVVLEVSYLYVYGEDEDGSSDSAYNFRTRPSYLVMSPDSAAAFKIVENLTDTLEA